MREPRGTGPGEKPVVRRRAVQQAARRAKGIKAFTICAAENLADNVYPGHGVKPAMMFRGDDAGAKATVGALIAELGWEPLDVGGRPQALHLEHWTLLWGRMVRAALKR